MTKNKITVFLVLNIVVEKKSLLATKKSLFHNIIVKNNVKIIVKVFINRCIGNRCIKKGNIVEYW